MFVILGSAVLMQITFIMLMSTCIRLLRRIKRKQKKAPNFVIKTVDSKFSDISVTKNASVIKSVENEKPSTSKRSGASAESKEKVNTKNGIALKKVFVQSKTAHIRTPLPKPIMLMKPSESMKLPSVVKNMTTVEKVTTARVSDDVNDSSRPPGETDDSSGVDARPSPTLNRTQDSKTIKVFDDDDDTCKNIESLDEDANKSE